MSHCYFYDFNQLVFFVFHYAFVHNLICLLTLLPYNVFVMKLNSSFDKVLLYVFNSCFSREFIVWVYVHVFKHFRSAGESWLLVNCTDRLLNLSFSLIFIIDYINAEFKIWTSERTCRSGLNQYTMMDQCATHAGRTGARIDKDECFGVLAIFWWEDTFESGLETG